MKDMLIAYILWFFLGGLGVHRFYLDSPITGIIWLLTGGLFGIGWLIDIVLIPGMVASCNARYGGGTQQVNVNVVTTQPQYIPQQMPPQQQYPPQQYPPQQQQYPPQQQQQYPPQAYDQQQQQQPPQYNPQQ